MAANDSDRALWREKFRLQDEQFRFPQHHVPHFVGRHLSRSRVVSWAFSYLCYLTHIRELAVSLGPRSVLDVGCGEGRFLGMLPPSVERRVGVDLSARALRFARAFYPEIEFLGTDAAELDETFDLVVSIEVLEHVPDEQVAPFLRTLAERTRPDGHVIVCVPTTVMALQRKHYRHYDSHLFEEQLRASGAALSIASLEFVYARSRLVDLYTRVTVNRWWAIEVHWLNRVVWNHVWRHLRLSTEGRGQHMVALLRREEGPGLGASGCG